MLGNISSLKNISNKNIDDILNLSQGANGKFIKLPNNLVAEKSDNKIIFRTMFHKANKFEYALDINKFNYVKEIKKYVSVSQDKKIFSSQFKNICTKKFFCDNLINIKIRNRNPGDSIFFKNVGHKKLNKFLAEKKIPNLERDCIPLIVCENDVIWILEPINIVSDADYEKNKVSIYIQIWEDLN